MNVDAAIKALQATPDLSAEVRLAVGNLKTVAGDFTGGTAEDLFTLAAHGMTDGDRVQLLYESAAGVVTGAVGDVFVIGDDETNTFRLYTEAGALVENTADGTAILAVISDAAVSLTNAESSTFASDGPDSSNTDPDPGWVTIG